MTATSSLTVTRELLELEELVISDPIVEGGFLLEAFGRPGRVPVNSLASSSLTHGDVVIRSRLQQATIPLSFFVQGETAADVAAGIDAAEECFTQFLYSVTVDIDGAAHGYSCDPSPVDSGPVEAAWVGGLIARLSVVLSVYPLASS